MVRNLHLNLETTDQVKFLGAHA